MSTGKTDIADDKNWGKATCKYCGREFEYFKPGKKPPCCGSLNCAYKLAMSKVKTINKPSETTEEYIARIQRQAEEDIKKLYGD